MEQWREDVIMHFNHNHDERGRFATSSDYRRYKKVSKYAKKLSKRQAKLEKQKIKYKKAERKTDKILNKLDRKRRIDYSYSIISERGKRYVMANVTDWKSGVSGQYKSKFK